MKYIFFLRTDNIMLKLCNQITLTACLQKILLTGSIRIWLLRLVRWNLLFINKISLLKTLYIRQDPLTLGVDHLIFDRSGERGIGSFGLGKDFFPRRKFSKIRLSQYQTARFSLRYGHYRTLRMHTARQWQPFMAVSPLMVAHSQTFSDLDNPSDCLDFCVSRNKNLK